MRGWLGHLTITCLRAPELATLRQTLEPLNVTLISMLSPVACVPLMHPLNIAPYYCNGETIGACQGCTAKPGAMNGIELVPQ